MGRFLRAELAAGRGYLPAGEHVLRAFSRPLAGVRVLIVGQDPYPTPGHPVGLSFSVAPDVRPLPRSLANIYRELADDLGVEPCPHGDLTGWFDQGVLLLNRVLTVQPGRSGSHRGRGWEQVTQRAIEVLAARGGPLVAILWGRDAQNLVPRAGWRAVHRQCAPLSPLRPQRLLRLPPLQPSQRAPRTSRCRADQLATRPDRALSLSKGHAVLFPELSNGHAASFPRGPSTSSGTVPSRPCHKLRARTLGGPSTGSGRQLNCRADAFPAR